MNIWNFTKEPDDYVNTWQVGLRCLMTEEDNPSSAGRLWLVGAVRKWGWIFNLRPNRQRGVWRQHVRVEGGGRGLCGVWGGKDEESCSESSISFCWDKNKSFWSSRFVWEGWRIRSLSEHNRSFGVWNYSLTLSDFVWVFF